MRDLRSFRVRYMEQKDLKKPQLDLRPGKWKPKKGKKVKKHRRLRLPVLLSGCVLLLAAAGLITFFAVKNSRVYTRVEVEAGDLTLVPEDFSKNGAPVSFDSSFSPDSVDFHTPGTYSVKLKSGVFHYTASLTVKDTVPPSGRAVAGMLSRGERCDPSALVADVKDETRVTVSFETEPDTASCGVRDVTVLLTDLGGNVTKLPTTLTVIPLYTVLVREAGGQLTPADFILPDCSVAELFPVGDDGSPAQVDLAALTESAGDHPLRFSADGLICDCVLRVKDTTPPVMVLRDVTSAVGAEVEADLFVESVQDAGSVSFTASFTAPLDQTGTQTVTIRGVDDSGNAAVGKATLTLVPDGEPPAILGAENIVSYVGKAVSYLSGVWAEDALDPKPSLTVDSGAVDLQKEGVYPVTYVATDAAGNRSEKQITLTLLTETVSEADVMAKAKEIVSSIVTPDMTPRDKVEAIYRWMKKNVAYRDGATIVDWQQAAYQGLTTHRGDCSVFQMTSRALLTAAGIENRLIDTVPYYNVHYWNLVNIGEGWYHFDATSFYDKQDFCYVDSATLAERSVHYRRSHTFDPARFSYVS